MTQNLGEVVSDHQKRQKIIEDYVDAQTSASPISFSVEPKPLLESESPQTNLESSAKDKGKVVPDVVEGSRKKSNRLAREAGNSIVPCSVRGGQASSKGALLGKVVKENVDMAIGRFLF
ncbi:hypothetical protein AMTR_s00003p00267040 [Amborella trichopoda]|uniref:Uncharacterized protein n=1 Tax=Amborella trichopoda TaxID=13333 RepID=W1P786_AMBTC|nr:hypothetical protein AMTR_s00003p00267040 [Amborella trichopoda]